MALFGGTFGALVAGNIGETEGSSISIGGEFGASTTGPSFIAILEDIESFLEDIVDPDMFPEGNLLFGAPTTPPDVGGQFPFPEPFPLIHTGGTKMTAGAGLVGITGGCSGGDIGVGTGGDFGGSIGVNVSGGTRMIAGCLVGITGGNVGGETGGDVGGGPVGNVGGGTVGNDPGEVGTLKLSPF